MRQHIILLPQQVFVGKTNKPYSSKYVEQRSCDFIINAVQTVNHLVQDEKTKNLYVSQKHEHKYFTFYLDSNNIKEAINLVNDHFKQSASRVTAEFMQTYEIVGASPFLEAESFETSLTIKEKVVYGWQIENVTNCDYA